MTEHWPQAVEVALLFLVPFVLIGGVESKAIPEEG